jgi:hypothetical protein
MMTGHHGTNKVNAQGILRTGFRKSKGKQWFGDGVYFFDDDQREALNWAIKVKKFETDFSVIRSDLSIKNPLKLHKAKEWDEFLRNKLNLQLNMGNSSFKHREITDGYVVEFLCQRIARLTGSPVDVVICGCRVPAYDWAIEVTDVPRIQTQLCVREISCITNTEIVEEAS